MDKSADKRRREKAFERRLGPSEIAREQFDKENKKVDDWRIWCPHCQRLIEGTLDEIHGHVASHK